MSTWLKDRKEIQKKLIQLGAGLMLGDLTRKRNELLRFLKYENKESKHKRDSIKHKEKLVLKAVKKLKKSKKRRYVKRNDEFWNKKELK